tara:strand:+ start:194 stop:637 length:444 start_codon:yes stop_codon:yes gene_type:complete
MQNNDIVYIYTDGACRGNPGPGGWGAILIYNSKEKEINGFSDLTTNNIMELTAVIQSLKILNRKCNIEITTDSTYVKNGINDWIHTWKNNNWKTANKKPVKNKELWVDLDKIVKNHSIKWHWVRGHTGHPENERADQLANDAIDSNL